MSAEKLKKYKEEYRKYLLSKEWLDKRNELLKIRGNLCEICGKGGIIHVHHLTYDRIFKELPEDLQVLCENCHRKIHKKEKIKNKKRLGKCIKLSRKQKQKKHLFKCIKHDRKTGLIK